MASSAIGSSLIAAAGVGTTQFNVETTAVGLADAETMVARERLTEKTDAATLKQTSFSSLRTALEGFKANITSLQVLSTLQKRTVASSDVATVSATVSQTAQPGSYGVEVTQLAKAQSLYSGSFSSLTDSVGTGTLSFSFGTATKAVTGAATAIASGKTDSDGIVITVAGTAVTIPDNQDLSTGAGVDSFLSAVNTAVNANTTLAGQGITASITDSATAGADTITITDAEGDAFTVNVAAPTGGSPAATQAQVEAALGVGDGSVAVDKLSLNPKRSSGSVVIDTTNNTLTGVRDAVNAAKLGVQASIVNDGSGYRLTFTSETTGAANSIQTTVSGDGDGNQTDASGLSRLVYNDSTKNLTESIKAQDAKLKVNGLAITSATNAVTEAVEGVTLNLEKAAAGQVKTVTVATDQSGLKTALQNFVLDFNALRDVTTSLGKYDLTGGNSGGLAGDPTLRSLASEVRTLASSSIQNLTGTTTTLSSIGITLSKNNDGKLALDATKLDAALKSDFDAVGKLFAAAGTPTDSLVNYSEHTADTKAGSYAVNITQLATQGKLVSGATVGASAGGSVTVAATNDTFSIKVDGISSGTIALTQRTYSSKSDLATEIQSKINGDATLQANSVSVVVNYNQTDNKFEITSSRYGSASKVEVLSVESEGAGAGQSGEIGLAIGGAATTGVDVAGTINGVAALGTGQYLTSSSGDSKGLKVQINGGVTGDRGSVAVSRGYADQLVTSVNRYVDTTNGMLKVREDALTAQLAQYTKDNTALDEKYETLLVRYRTQYATLNGLLGQLETQREWMASTFKGMSGND